MKVATFLYAGYEGGDVAEKIHNVATLCKFFRH